MYIITIDPDKCQGDGDCNEVCPVTVLGLAEVNGNKITILQGSVDDCLGCGSCAATCTHEAITVTEV
jgi:NAD-dependent dihydropyrimidine dehydrogenase PreA subunit